MAGWQSSIVSFEPDVDPTDLLAHPLNARRHGGHQRQILREALGRFGWIAPVIVNQRTAHVLDGHARIEEAITAGSTLPVLYVDLPPEEESAVLAGFDPIAALASYDDEVLVDLLADVSGHWEGTTFNQDDLDELLNTTLGHAEPEMGDISEPSAIERLDQYQKLGVRAVILEMSLPEYKWWIDQTRTARESLGIADNARLVLSLVANVNGTSPP